MALIKNQLILIHCRRVFHKYRNSLPNETSNLNPKMHYHVFADAVYWEDERIRHPELENLFRDVLHHRTALIAGTKKSEQNQQSRKVYGLAKKYFPNWIGFQPARSSYNAELAHRISRIRKVSSWKLDKLMKESEE